MTVKLLKRLFREKSAKEMMIYNSEKELERYRKVEKSIKKEMDKLKFELILAEKMIKANIEILDETRK